MVQITEDTTREQVVEAFASGLEIESIDGFDVASLYCPHCIVWIGDPDDSAIAHVSVTHAGGTCVDGDEPDFESEDQLIEWIGYR